MKCKPAKLNTYTVEYISTVDLFQTKFYKISLMKFREFFQSYVLGMLSQYGWVGSVIRYYET